MLKKVDHEDGDQGDDDPGAAGELGHRDVQHHDAGGRGPDAVDDALDLPVLALRLAGPVHHHAGLADGEAQEHPQGVEGQQDVRVGVEGQHQEPREDGEDHDAVGEHQPVAHAGELVGQEPVLGVQRGQAREVRVGRVGRHHEDGEREALDHVVVDLGRQAQWPWVPIDRPAELGEQRLLHDGRIRAVVVDHAEVVGQQGDPQEHRAQEEHHARSWSWRRSWPAGSLKAVTPLEMASTPVRAVHPAE